MGFRNARRKADLTQAEVAEKLGVCQSTIACWETGFSRPRIDKLRMLALLYGCTVDDLLDGLPGKENHLKGKEGRKGKPPACAGGKKGTTANENPFHLSF